MKNWLWNAYIWLDLSHRDLFNQTLSPKCHRFLCYMRKEEQNTTLLEENESRSWYFTVSAVPGSSNQESQSRVKSFFQKVLSNFLLGDPILIYWETECNRLGREIGEQIAMPRAASLRRNICVVQMHVQRAKDAGDANCSFRQFAGEAFCSFR